MANKKLITFLSLVVLLQLSIATPVPDDDSKSTEAPDAKNELKKYAVLEFNKVATIILPKDVEVLKGVLNDLKTDNKDTEADDKLIKEIDELLKKFDEADPETKIALEWFLKINAIMDPVEQNTRLHELLEKNGLKAVRDSFDAEIEPKIDELGTKVKSYYDSLDATEKEQEKGITKWLKEFDDKDNDIGDKINLLLDFIADTDDSGERK